MTNYDLRLSAGEHERIDKAELALKSSVRAHEQMRELYFGNVWTRVGMASDDVSWAVEMNKLKDDVENYVTFCIDVVATTARSFGALEPFRECLAQKAADVKKRAFALIDQRDLLLLDSHISQVASDRVFKWQNWADQELKPAWMTQPEASPGDTERNSEVAAKVEGAELEHRISAVAENVSTQPRTRPPSQFEIERYANEIFTAGLEDRIDEYARKQAQALHRARSTNNVGAHLPTLIQCKRERLRAEILILADAWVLAGTTYNVPLGKWAEKAVEKAAALMAGGVRSALQGEIDLHVARTRTSRNTGGACEIDRELNSTIRRAKLRLKTQRIKAERLLKSDVKEPRTAPAPLSKPISPAFEGDNQKRRGRPVIIPEERKQAAVECKANGGTNRDAAKLIYDTRYPTPQQVKNVPAILRNYQQGSKRRNSTGSVRLKTSSKAQQK